MWDMLTAVADHNADQAPSSWPVALATDIYLGAIGGFVVAAHYLGWFIQSPWPVAAAGTVVALSMPVMIWVRICAAWQNMQYNKARRRWAELGRDAANGRSDT